MKALLDTHVFLWWITDDQRLSSRVREIIADGTNEILFSAASGWEIAIKTRLGRLQLPDDPEIFIPEQLELNAIEVLPCRLGMLSMFTNFRVIIEILLITCSLLRLSWKSYLFWQPIHRFRGIRWKSSGNHRRREQTTFLEGFTPFLLPFVILKI